MYVRLIANLFLLFLLFIFQMAFVSGLPSWFSNINAVLVVLTLIMGFGDLKTSLVWAVILGTFLDMYSFSVFGLNIFCLALALLAANFLLENLLTNRSLYSILALVAIASLVFQLASLAIVSLYGLFSPGGIGLELSIHFFLDELSKVIGNMLLAFILFHVLSFISKRFRPMFLIR